MGKRPPLTKDILVEDLVEAYPELIGPLLHEGVVCMVCGESYWGTLEELAQSKGIADTDELIASLQEKVTPSD